MPIVFSKLLNRSKRGKDSSQSSSPAPSAGRPSTSQIPGSPDEKKKLYFAAGITALKHLKEISEASGLLAPLKAACGAMTVILETIEAMDGNKEAWKSTLQAIRRHRRTFQQQLKNMNTESVFLDAEPGLLDPIKAYGQDLESILGAIMLDNGISATNFPSEHKFQGLLTFMKQYGTVKVEAETINEYAGELDDAMKQFMASMTVYMGFKLHSIDQGLQKLVLSSSKTNKGSPSPNEIKLKLRPRLVPNFVGHEEILVAMREVHFTSGHVRQQAPVITILSGIGGLGKTQTALKFAQEFEEMYPDISVFFMDASAPEKIESDLETVIRSRGTAYNSKSYEDALMWLAIGLKNWLIILDNADDPNMDTVRYIPQCMHGHVVITTRNSTLAALAPNASHALEGLSIPDSITLLLTASNYPDDEDNHGLAEKIVLELGCLPLALAHAAGYIFVHRCLGTYLDMYRRNRERILSSTNSKLLNDYRSSVAMTIEMSLEKLSEQARDIMKLFSRLQETSIPLSIIVKAAERAFKHVERTEGSSLTAETLAQADVLGRIFDPGGEWSEFDFNEHIQECLQYSLLRLTTQNEDKFYSMHVLVLSHLQGDTLIHDRQPERLVCRLLGSAVMLGKEYEFLAFNRLLLPHIRLVRIEDVTEAGDHYSFGEVLDVVGNARQALVHQEKCVEIWRKSLGKENQRTIAAMTNLAISYMNVGKNRASLELKEEVLSLQKKLLGPEHLYTVQAMGNLADLYRNMDKNQAALELEEEVLSLRRRLLGPEHPDTVLAMGNLAISYANVSKNQAALELEEEVLSLRKRLLGPEHPDAVQTMGNLAVSYANVGKSQAALGLKEEVLSLRKRLLGPEHPDTVRAMSSLAASYANVGRTQAALELGEEVLSLRTKLLGPQHPGTLLIMRNLLGTYKELDMRSQRLNLLRLAVPAYEAAESYGINHPETIKLRNDLNELSAHGGN